MNGYAADKGQFPYQVRELQAYPLGPNLRLKLAGITLVGSNYFEQKYTTSRLIVNW